MAKYDIAIVGAGPGGAAAAKLAADKGLKVVMFERGRWPGEKNMSGAFVFTSFENEIIPDFANEFSAAIAKGEVKGWNTGKNWRFLARPVKWPLTGGGKLHLECEMPPEPGESTVPNFWQVWRPDFDKWFASFAVKAGAELRTSTLVVDVLRDSPTSPVKGVILENGEEVEATITILADGVYGPVTRKAGLRGYWDNGVLNSCAKQVYELPDGVSPIDFLGEGREENLPTEESITCFKENDKWYVIARGYANMGATNRYEVQRPLPTYAANFAIWQQLYARSQASSNPIIREWFPKAKLHYYSARIYTHNNFAFMPGGWSGTSYADGVMAIGEAMQGTTMEGWGVHVATESAKIAVDIAAKAITKGDVSGTVLKEFEDRWTKCGFVGDGAVEVPSLTQMLLPMLMTMARFDHYKWGPDKTLLEIYGDALRRMIKQLPVVLEMWKAFKPVLKAGNISPSFVSKVAEIADTIQEEN